MLPAVSELCACYLLFDSRVISNELYFWIGEEVEEKKGASIDQSIILDYLSQS